MSLALRALTERYFGDLGPQAVETMYRIALKESSGQVGAHNPQDPYGGSYGLFQINGVHGYDPQRLASDPEYNAAAARAVYDKQGFQAWSTYPAAVQEMGMATDPSQMSDEELLAALGGGSNWSAGSVPIGYSTDGQGNYYRASVNGPIKVSFEEVQAAALAQARASKSIDRAGAAPNRQVITDERTGEAVIYDPATGGFSRSGQQVGFAGIDPREKAAAEQQDSAANRAVDVRGQTLDALNRAQTNLITAARDADNAKVERGKTRESARQADLQAAVQQYQTALNLIPQLGELSLKESERVQDILASGEDFLARAHESRGGNSPLGRVTQADQLNALSESLNSLRTMMNTAIAQSPMARGGGFSGIDPYVAPDMSNFGTSLDTAGAYVEPEPYRFSAPPAVSAGSAPAPAGGFTPAVVDEQGYIPPPMPAQPAPAAAAVPPRAGGELIDDAPNVAGWEGNQLGPSNWQMPNQWAVPNAQGGTSGAGLPDNPAWTNGVGASGGGLAGVFKKLFGGSGKSSGAIPPAYGQVPGYSGGGFTKEGVFKGNEEGAELFLNPTNAPIAVIDAKTTKEVAPENVPGYATGTGYNIASSAVSPAATGGFVPGMTTPDGRMIENSRGDYSVTPGGPRFGATIPVADALLESQPGGGGTPFGYQASLTPKVTQEELIRMSRANMPPAVAAVLAGQPLPARQSLKSGLTGDPLRPFTARQLMSLDEQELKALGTATSVEYNAGLPYLAGQTARMYGPSQQRRGGFVGAL